MTLLHNSETSNSRNKRKNVPRKLRRKLPNIINDDDPNRTYQSSEASGRRSITPSPETLKESGKSVEDFDEHQQPLNNTEISSHDAKTECLIYANNNHKLLFASNGTESGTGDRRCKIKKLSSKIQNGSSREDFQNNNGLLTSSNHPYTTTNTSTVNSIGTGSTTNNYNNRSKTLDDLLNDPVLPNTSSPKDNINDIKNVKKDGSSTDNIISSHQQDDPLLDSATKSLLLQHQSKLLTELFNYSNFYHRIHRQFQDQFERPDNEKSGNNNNNDLAAAAFTADTGGFNFNNITGGNNPSSLDSNVLHGNGYSNNITAAIDGGGTSVMSDFPLGNTAAPLPPFLPPFLLDYHHHPSSYTSISSATAVTNKVHPVVSSPSKRQHAAAVAMQSSLSLLAGTGGGNRNFTSGPGSAASATAYKTGYGGGSNTATGGTGRICDVCGKVYASSSTLSRHKRIHRSPLLGGGPRGATHGNARNALSSAVTVSSLPFHLAASVNAFQHHHHHQPPSSIVASLINNNHNNNNNSSLNHNVDPQNIWGAVTGGSGGILSSYHSDNLRNLLTTTSTKLLSSSSSVTGKTRRDRDDISPPNKNKKHETYNTSNTRSNRRKENPQPLNNPETILHHSTSQSPNIDDSATSPGIPGPKRHTCVLCGKTFSRLWLLKGHLEVSHLDDDDIVDNNNSYEETTNIDDTDNEIKKFGKNVNGLNQESGDKNS